MERRSSSGPFSEDKTLRDCQDPGRLLRAVTDTPLWKNRPHERTHRLLQGLPYVATWANVGACAPNPGVSARTALFGAPVPPLRPAPRRGWAGPGQALVAPGPPSVGCPPVFGSLTAWAVFRRVAPGRSR